MTERCLVVERYVILSLVTITTAEWYCCCWSLGTTRESGDGRWTLRGNKRKSQLPMNNHETEEGIGGRARTQTPTLRNTNMGSTLVFFIAFTSWLEDEKMRGNVNQTYVSVWSFFLFFLYFYLWSAGMRLQQAAGHVGREIEDDEKHESSTVWVRSESYHANRDHRTLAAAEGGWLLCEGLRSAPDQCWCRNAEFDFLYENLWLKTWKGKMIMKKVNTISMTHLLSQAEYICPFTRLSWWLALILS